MTPLYESKEEVVQSELATFFEVFPNGTVWSNDINGQGYDVVLAAKNGPMQIDVGALEARLASPDHFPVAQSLRDVGFWSAFDLLSTYAGRAEDLGPWLSDAAINRDRNLRLMYIAGEGLNLYQQAGIYSDILQYRDFPDDLFVGPPERREALRVMIESNQ